MNLNELKKVVTEANAQSMKPVYDRIKEAAVSGASNVTFKYCETRVSLLEGGSQLEEINELEVTKLRNDGYTVHWRGDEVTVSGW